MSLLADYTKNRIQAGLSKGQIRDELLAVGWSEEEVDASYRDGLVALGIPVPNDVDRPSLAKQPSTVDIVINFFSFILLAIVATALGTLYFQIINHVFPDPQATMHGLGERFITEAIHHSIASLIISFPLYYLTMRHLFRRFHTDEVRLESRLTKWFTYLVLLAASITIVGNLITILFKLFQGEFSVRFLLKALTILAIAGLVFGFYFIERQMIQYKKTVSRTAFQGFAWSVTVLVALGVVFGFMAAGSPKEARMYAFDQERAWQLGELSRCIDRYGRELGQLPSSLEELKKTSQFAICGNYMHDPETNAPYEYRIITPFRQQGPAKLGEFELCATFALPSTSNGQDPMYLGRLNAIWQEHSAGRNCDTVTVQLVGRKATTAPD
ncbi:DUF5671 domain-containing protein [Thiomicrorhabdus sp. ZW0627]|uniref:DUF5671 domain-containing protein n=1 Tax=Thiomicrorhabdus sp. ZW0627 TaxID=3039774 RepID=UPI0024372A25|nr:DUF5671 domain-containing protein [Thiomicrorhabdus sp. ZW0627]MDG6774836.1 DUF5671 domain-containing protein [Thiomicrorhabdus sp. ZW0627]